jgi:hypothetical protein
MDGGGRSRARARDRSERTRMTCGSRGSVAEGGGKEYPFGLG